MPRIDLQEPPPKRWVKPFLSRGGTERLGAILDYQAHGPNDGDRALAQRIVADAPRFLYGHDVNARLGNAAWAHLTLDNEEEAWRELQIIQRAAATFVKNRRRPASAATLFLFTFLALRRNDKPMARTGIVLANFGPLTQGENEDLLALTRLAA